MSNVRVSTVIDALLKSNDSATAKSILGLSSGTGGTAGTSGINGVAGTSGSSGTIGPTGSSGSSGFNGSSGSSGLNGSSGSSGSSGASGSNGSSGVNGASGSNGSSGTSGPVGSSGESGSSGSSGSSGVSITFNNNTNDYVLTATGTANTINGESNLTFDGNNLYINGTLVQDSVSQSISGTAALTIDVQASNLHVISVASGAVTSSITYNNRSNDPKVNTLILVFKFSGTYTITWTDVLWANGATPTLTATNGYADVIMLTSYKGGAATPVWIGTVIGQAYTSTNL